MAPKDLPAGVTAPAVSAIEDLLRLFHAVDTFPRGSLYEGYYAVFAAVRYEKIWMPVLDAYRSNLCPPLDVAFAWFVHRNDPAAYRKQLAAKGRSSSACPSQDEAFRFGILAVLQQARWEAAAPSRHPAWPPPPPGDARDLAALVGAPGKGKKATPPAFANDVARSMRRFAPLLRSWLRPHFLDTDFLERARERYGRFLRLRITHPQHRLVPAADIALVWHTHLGLSVEYQTACRAMALAAPGCTADFGPEYLGMGAKEREAALAETAALWRQEYGEPYEDADTAWVDAAVPYPLAAHDSPLAFALRAFDDNPMAAQQAAALREASQVTGVPFPSSAQTVPRAGAHALYAAWLAAGRAQRCHEEVTAACCCRVGSGSARSIKKTLEHTAVSLVSLAYFLELPAFSSHDYLQRIVSRKGLWKPHKENGASAPMEGAAAAASFAPSDPELYLKDSAWRMGGLAALLDYTSSKPGAPPPPPSTASGDFSLWGCLASTQHECALRQAFDTQWATAQKGTVNQVRSTYMRRRNSLDGANHVLYGGGHGYYAATWGPHDAGLVDHSVIGCARSHGHGHGSGLGHGGDGHVMGIHDFGGGHHGASHGDAGGDGGGGCGGGGGGCGGGGG